MKWGRGLPWRTMLRRALQSLRDTAARRSRSEPAARPWCDGCAQNALVAVADRFSGRDATMPHWLAHALGELIVELRVELTWTMLEHPLGDADVAHHLRGTGEVAPSAWTPEQRAANEIFADHHRLVDLWLREEMRALAPWIERILRAGARVGPGVPVSSSYVEAAVLGRDRDLEGREPIWWSACELWGRSFDEDRGSGGEETPADHPLQEAVAWPRWLTLEERDRFLRCLDVAVEQRADEHRGQLMRVVRRMPDPRERMAEVLVVDAECTQYALELRETLAAQLARDRSDLALLLATVSHEAASRRDWPMP